MELIIPVGAKLVLDFLGPLQPLFTFQLAFLKIGLFGGCIAHQK